MGTPIVTRRDNMDTAHEEIRLDVLRRLAEQAMTDLDFRAVARHDLLGALRQYGYDLNERELALVLRFRAALEEAGVDLFLTQRLTEADKDLLRQALA
jgi:hypothetical protein